MPEITTRQYHGDWWPSEWDGLDYETAADCTPKLYGVSFGNGNDGVSHMFADYYVRTSDPWTLARAALLGQFKSDYMDQANDEMEVDGEADYTISACLYEPLDREEPETHWYCQTCHHEWDGANEMDCCPKCGADELESSENEYDSYSDANGAYMICEVFPENEPRDSVPSYDSLEDCFGDDAQELNIARDA